jgi:hypothetical protein
MKVAIIYNKDLSGVINVFGMQNKEVYNPETVKRVASALESGGHNVEIIDRRTQCGDYRWKHEGDRAASTIYAQGYRW